MDDSSAQISVSNVLASHIATNAQIQSSSRSNRGSYLSADSYLSLQIRRIVRENYTKRLDSFYSIKGQSEQYKRFLYLLNAHVLSNKSMLKLLEPYGFTLASIANEDRALGLITPELIDFLASRFMIDPNWLVCKTDRLRTQTSSNQVEPIMIIKKYLSSLIAGEMGRLVIVTDERARNNDAHNAYFHIYLSRFLHLNEEIVELSELGLENRELQVYECLARFDYHNESARRGFKYVMHMFQYMQSQVGKPIDEILISSDTLRCLDDSLQIVNSHLQKDIMSLQIHWEDINLKHVGEFPETGLRSDEYEENKILKHRFENSGIKEIIDELISIYIRKSNEVHNLDEMFKAIKLQ